ncbi:MAG: TetR family transcriptional regulator [Alphaproteobacteria bacterium]|nr:TetR family transcriptional regulator [Alphaproteobacteria bacterium]
MDPVKGGRRVKRSKTSDVARPAGGRQQPSRSDESRAYILTAAARLFRSQGYAATTLRQIAAAAGIQAGSIYYHFASKDEILLHVLDAGINRVFEAVRSRVGSLPPGASHRDRIQAAIAGHLFGLLRHGDFTSASIRVYGQIPDALKRRHRAVRKEYSQYWDEMIAAAHAAGEIRHDVSPKIMRLYLVGSLNWTVEWFNPRRGRADDLVENICRVVFGGIEAPHILACGKPPGLTDIHAVTSVIGG